MARTETLMKAARRFLSQNPLSILLLFLPLTLAAGLLDWPPLAVFIPACIAIIPLAAFIGEATETLAHFSGPCIGGLLNATLGNAAGHLVAVRFARHNKMALTVDIAVSSSLQVALLVAPLSVFISLLLGHPLTLVFNAFELVAWRPV